MTRKEFETAHKVVESHYWAIFSEHYRVWTLIQGNNFICIVGTCWDADRLDIGRVGIVPHERYMSTAAGRRRASDI